ncbi:HAMP domain-containing sensor histidine kinase [Salinigranum marinum]|uniref:sensor histidine kinase n=1 Tax=Salinigranum marinum TaxID=1515595 RepID=UPI002989CDED|nr:HAMP domain-containing sensor histidine kinase [Salinigranum marinum]
MTDECTAAIPVDAFPDPVLAYLVDGRDARITTTNASFERRFGDMSPENFVSTVFDRFSHSTTTGNQDPITHVVRGDRVGIYLNSPGDRGTFFARVIPSEEGAGYLVFLDLEDCPTIEELPAVDQVSSVLSHDLRNPLDVAKAHLTAARETGDPDHFESVADAHDRMERIIRDVLTLTRGDAVVDPSNQVSIETAATDAWQSVDTDGAILDLVGSLPTVTADADRVRRLFENLFRNAVEHGSTGNRTEPGDTVEYNATNGQRKSDDNVEHNSTSHQSQTPDDSVEHSSTDNRTQSGDSVDYDSDAPAPNTHGDRGEWNPGTREQPLDRSKETTSEGSLTVTVGALEDGFYVADDGTGIPADERETVFEPGHSTMNGGTGLGLAIVEQIIAVHDWNVTLTTADCGGARFEIRF